MNLMDLFIRIGLKDEASGPIRKISGAVGNGLKTAAKIGAAGVGVASAALVKLGKDAIQSYADFEQLKGGVEKLFGSSGQSFAQYMETFEGSTQEGFEKYQALQRAQNAVMENANNAYKTAGMSANDYLDTVTSFSAALINGLEGDTEEAARISDMAIRDMSDNANTFGTDISSIQAAYQGFAKGNFTMLDNLKLGYGGTAGEMARLINESGVLQGEFEATAENVKDIPFDIMIQAINKTQKEMGIAGTTAKESMHTISGSVNSAKAAWANLVTGIGDENANLDDLINNFLETIIGVNGEGGVINNIVPVVERVLNGVSKLISSVLPKLIPLAVRLIEENLPKLLEAGSEILAALLVGLASALPSLIRAIPTIVKTFVEALKDNWPEIKKAGGELLDALGDGISAVWDKVKEWGKEIGAKLIEGILGVLGEFWADVKKSFNFYAFGEGRNEGLENFDWTGMNFATGKDYVPYDNFPARLHRGEAVLTAREADNWRRGESGGKIVNFSPTINISGDISNPREKAEELMIEMKHILDREAAAYA